MCLRYFNYNLKTYVATYAGYCMLFGPKQSSGSVSASPHTYFRPRPLPSHFSAAYVYVNVVIRSTRPRYLDI